MKVSLIFFSSGTSGAAAFSCDRFNSLIFAGCESFFSAAVAAAAGEVEVVVVHELPLLIFRIIRGESQPESSVLELVVVTSSGWLIDGGGLDGGSTASAAAAAAFG